jgi:hypothetical protein
MVQKNAEVDTPFPDNVWEVIQKVEEEYLAEVDNILEPLWNAGVGPYRFVELGKWLNTIALQNLPTKPDEGLQSEIADYFSDKSRQAYYQALKDHIEEAGNELLQQYFAEDFLGTIGTYEQFYRSALSKKDSWEASGVAVKDMLEIFRSQLKQKLVAKGWPEEEVAESRWVETAASIKRFIQGLDQIHSDYVESREQPDPFRDALMHTPTRPTESAMLKNLVKSANLLDKAGYVDETSKIDQALFALAQTPGGQVASALLVGQAVSQAATGIITTLQQLRQKNITAIPAESAAMLERYNQALGYSVSQLHELLRQQQLGEQR